MMQQRSLVIYCTISLTWTDATTAYLQAREYATYNRDAEVPQNKMMQGKQVADHGESSCIMLNCIEWYYMTFVADVNIVALHGLTL